MQSADSENWQKVTSIIKINQIISNRYVVVQQLLSAFDLPHSSPFGRMTFSDARKRKIQQHDEASSAASVSGNQQQRRGAGTSIATAAPKGLKLSFLCLIISMLLLLFGFGIYLDSTSPILERIAFKLGYDKSQYAVIIDAGSTGSRVLAYKFHRSLIDNKLVLDEEIFKERKPGLSSFADNPEKGANSIKLLLDEAKAFIPSNKWADSPLVLKATAGLRLLPQSKAENLLNTVRELFTKSAFSVDGNAVEIMDGTDEGIFSWFTVNFLLGRLSKSNQAAALDLGGGSTQVTFAPTDPAQVPIYEKHMHVVHTLNREINVFTHSYLGLGLMAARHAVFSNTYGRKETHLETVCVNPIISNRTWIYANVEYKISGKDNFKSTQENPVVNFDACLDVIKSKIMPLIKPKPFTLKQHTIAAFSYYFERAIESGLIDPFAGGEITVEDYRKKASEVCAIPNDEQPFMCFDLTFISVLLREGFGLNDGKKIKLYKKIDGHEISWALGCAYNVLTNDERFNI